MLHPPSARPRPLLRALLLLLLISTGAAAFRVPPPDEDVLRRIVQRVQQFYGAALPEKACTSTGPGTRPAKPSGLRPTW